MYDIDHLIFQEYSGQTGYGTMPYFVGKQYGNGWLRNIARIAFPFRRKALGFVGNVAMNTASDLIHNENKTVGEALSENAIAAVKNVVKRKAPPPSNSTINGSGFTKRRKLIV